MDTEAKRELYNYLYEQADFLWKRYNPCNITEGICLAMWKHKRSDTCCTASRFTDDHVNNKCKDLGPFGCKIKSLACKLWLCNDIDTADLRPEFRITLNALRKVAMDYGLTTFRGTFEDRMEEDR